MPEYIEIDVELLLLAASESDLDKVELAARISDMKPSERRVLRDAVQTLQDSLEADALARHLARDKRRQT